MGSQFSVMTIFRSISSTLHRVWDFSLFVNFLMFGVLNHTDKELLDILCCGEFGATVQFKFLRYARSSM